MERETRCSWGSLTNFDSAGSGGNKRKTCRASKNFLGKIWRIRNFGSEKPEICFFPFFSRLKGVSGLYLSAVQQYSELWKTSEGKNWREKFWEKILQVKKMPSCQPPSRPKSKQIDPRFEYCVRLRWVSLPPLSPHRHLCWQLSTPLDRNNLLYPDCLSFVQFNCLSCLIVWILCRIFFFTLRPDCHLSCEYL